eukprot:c21423_g1_i2.p1 GENE.c21423_g1_i2~~c21423_g1_i2.p1  ORF type:complete len:1102 (+),score=452.85 c21423_g1_i2:35-3307(+)
MFWSQSDDVEEVEKDFMETCKKIAERQKVASDELIEKLVNELQQKIGSQVEFQILSALLVVAEDERNKKLLVEKGLLKPLLSLIRDTVDEKVLNAAGKVLWLLSTSERNRSRIVNEGGFQAVSVLSSSLISHVQYSGARLLLELSSDEQIRLRVLQSDLLNTVSDLLCSETDNVQNAAANTIQLLATADPECEAFGSNRTVNKLMDLITVGNENCQFAACSAIRSICKCASHKEKFLGLNILTHLVKFLKEDSDRLRLIGMTTLLSLQLSADVTEQIIQKENKVIIEKIIKDIVQECKDIQLQKATLRFIGALIKHENARRVIVSKISLNHYVTLLFSSYSEIRAATTSVLTNLLRDVECQKQFFQVGLGTQLVKKIADKFAPIEHIMASVTVIHSVAHLSECGKCFSANDSVTDQLNVLSSQDLIAALIIAELSEISPINTKIDYLSVAGFLDQADYKSKFHSNLVIWDDVSLSRLQFLSKSKVRVIKRLTAWTFCHIFSFPNNLDELTVSKTLETVQILHKTSVTEVANDNLEQLAQDALKLIALNGPIMNDAEQRYENCMKIVAKESAELSIIAERFNAVQDKIKCLDLQRIEDQAPLFQAQAIFPSDVNEKLLSVKSIRTEITEGEALKKIRAMEEEMRSTLHLMETLKALEQKKEMIENLAKIRAVLEELKKEVQKHKKLLVTAQKNKENEEQNILAIQKVIQEYKFERHEKEQRMMAIMSELVDLQYFLENNPGVLKQFYESKKTLEGKMVELQEKLKVVNQKIGQTNEQITVHKENAKSFEKKLALLGKAKTSADNCKNLKEEMQLKYGAELYDNEDFMALQSSVMNKVFKNLQEVKEGEPELDTAVQKPEKADAMTTEREMFATLNRMFHEVNSKIGFYSAQYKTQESILQDQNQEKQKIEDEIALLQDQLNDLDRQIKLSAAPEGLAEKKEALEEELKNLKKQVEAIDAKVDENEKKRKAAHDNLLELSANVTGEEAALKRFTNEQLETAKKLETENRLIAALLNQFNFDYATFQSKRGGLQNEMKRLEDGLSAWMELFKVEQDRRTVAETAIATLIANFTSFNDGLKDVRSAPIFRTKTV